MTGDLDKYGFPPAKTAYSVGAMPRKGAAAVSGTVLLALGVGAVVAGADGLRNDVSLPYLTLFCVLAGIVLGAAMVWLLMRFGAGTDGLRRAQGLDPGGRLYDFAADLELLACEVAR